MKENVNNPNIEEAEGTYEQFDIDDTFSQDKQNKGVLFSSKKYIKYILITFFLLCIILFLFNLTKNKHILNNIEFKSSPKKIKIPLENDEFKIKNELKIIENIITLNSSLRGIDLIDGKQQIIVITALVTINNKCFTSNCFDCFVNQEMNYPKLSDKEALDKTLDETDLCYTPLKYIYYNPKMSQKDNKNIVYSVWNKYLRKLVNFKGGYYIDKFNTEKYNSEYVQAYIQGYEFTIIDHIYEKNNKNYKYNNRTLKFDEIILDIKCQRKGDDINYPELSDKEAFDKVFRELDLRGTEVKNIYKKYNPEKPRADNSELGGIFYPYQEYFVWNNYKREMIQLHGVYGDNYHIIDPWSNNEYLQSARQGYKFTSMEHIYEKDKKFYKYNESIEIFEEIKLDSI